MDIIVEISGQRYNVTDPEIAEHIRYFVQHTDLMGLRRMREYDLLIKRTTDGTSYKVLNGSLPYTRRTQKR
jgi:hypothetical protein